MKKGLAAVWMLCSLLAAASGCAQQHSGLQDGYYTAETADFDADGWKEYITIYICDNRIITAEYDAYNASGMVKSWDIEYMRAMKAADGSYPNEYTRAYVQALVDRQDPAEVHGVTGATNSYKLFLLLVQAVMEKAKSGDNQIALVKPLTH